MGVRWSNGAEPDPSRDRIAGGFLLRRSGRGEVGEGRREGRGGGNKRFWDWRVGLEGTGRSGLRGGRREGGAEEGRGEEDACKKKLSLTT